MSRVMKVRSGLDAQAVSALFVGFGSVIGLSHYIKHTLLLSFYKEYIELKGEDGPVVPSLKLSNLVDSVTEDLKDKASEYTSTEPVIVPGLKTFNVGTCGTFQGGLIALPKFFECSTIDDLKSKFKVKRKEDNSPVKSEEPYNSLLLSEDAKKYAIAREIVLINNMEVYINTILPGALPGLFGVVVSANSNIQKLPSSSRFLFYSLVVFSGFYFWRKICTASRHYFDKCAEEDIATLGESYIKGALEYHSKAIERNKYDIEIEGQEVSLLYKLRERMEVFKPRSVSSASVIEYYKKILNDKIESNQVKA